MWLSDCSYILYIFSANIFYAAVGIQQNSGADTNFTMQVISKLYM